MADIKLIGNDDGVYSLFLSANFYYYQRFTAIQSGRLSSIRVKSSKDAGVAVAIYSDIGDLPNNCMSSVGTTSISAGWNNIQMSPVSIVSGTMYWLAVNTNTSSAIFRNSSGHNTKSADGAFTSWANSPQYLSSFSDRDIAIAGWGSTGCPRQAAHMRRLM
jgi:hypothetical protein